MEDEVPPWQMHEADSNQQEETSESWIQPCFLDHE